MAVTTSLIQPKLSGLSTQLTPSSDPSSHLPPLFLDTLKRNLTDKEAAKFSLVNKHWYRILTGRPFTPLEGKSDRYALMRILTRQNADEILEQTGYRIQWPQGQEYLHVVTSWTEKVTNQLCLGRGSFGVFCIGYALKQKKYVGIKITEGNHEVEMELQTQQSFAEIPHIMQSIDACRLVSQKGEVSLYQFMDLAGLGNASKLSRTIQKLDDLTFKEHIQFHLIKGFLLGLSFMHSRNRFHLDFKLDNLVIDHRGEVFLIDFGCTVESRDKQISGLYSKGDYNYYSPERWMANYDIGELCDGSKVDSWAAGMAILELISGEPTPFKRLEIEKILCEPAPKGWTRQKVLQQYFEEKLASIPDIKQCKPDSIWAVIKGLLAFDPNKRLSVEETLQKPWFVYKMIEAHQHEEGTLRRLKELIQQQTLETTLPPNKLVYAKGGGFTQTKTIAQTKAWGILSPQDLPLPHFANYVPRLELQSILQKRLLTDMRFTACQGSPGIGKTQLVTYLTHDQKIKDHYGMRLWFRSADQPTQIEIQYLTLAQELNLADDKTTFKEAFPRILHYIKTYREKHKKPLLIVFDNADDPKVLRPYLPEGANILVTTRSKEWEETIAVERLSLNEGQILVQKLLSREEPDARALCEYFAYIPIGIVQASAYIRNHGLKIPVYLNMLKDSSDVLERDEKLYGKELPYSMASLYKLTLKELENTKSLELLQCLACLNSERISQELVLDLANNEKNVFQILLDYALLQQTSIEAYSMHRMIQELTHKHAQQKRMTMCLIKAMEKVKKKYHSHPTNEQISSNREMFLHGQTLLHWSDISPVPQILKGSVANTMHWLGEELNALGQLKEAFSIRKKALQLVSEICKQDDPRLAPYLADLGMSYGLSGESKKAIDCYTKAIEIETKAHGEESHHVATSLSNLGMCQWALGKHREAIRLHERALKIRRKIYGEMHFDVALSLNNLGVCWSDLGEHRKAVEVIQQAIIIKKEIYGDAHTEVAISLNNLGTSLYSLGQTSKAKEMFESALEIQKKTYGENHPTVATNLNNLGLCLSDLKQYREAIQLYEKSLEIKKGIYGPVHSEVANTLNNLGTAWNYLGEKKKAVKFLEDALEITEKALGEKHPDMANRLNNLGACLASQGKHKKAIELYEKALTINKTTLGETHPVVGDTLNNLAVTWHDIGDKQKAAQYLEQAIEIYSETYGENDPRVVQSQQILKLLKSNSGCFIM